MSLAAISQTAKIYGNVMDTSSHNTSAFAALELKSTSFEKHTSADIEGNFNFTNLTEGNYQLSVKYVGCKSIDTTIKVNKGDSIWLNLKLLCKPSIICVEITVGLNAKLAEQEIAEGHPRLILSGGISPIVYVGQEIFEEKYKIKYYDYGCVSPSEKEMIEYNKTIFKYLDKRYGKKW